MARDTQSEKLVSETEDAVGVVEEVSGKQEVSSLLLTSCATPHRSCLQQKTKSAGTESARTKKARKSTSKRSA
jgi:hypothetical protein